MSYHIIKTYESFEEGFNDLTKHVPDILKYTGEIVKEEEIISNLIGIMSKNVPTIKNPDYPNTYALNIHAREVSFKTPGYLAFGWKVHVDANYKITYGFRVQIINKNKFAPANPVINQLVADGWKMISDNTSYQRQQEPVKE